MDRPQKEDYSYKFENIQIFKDQQLGHGAYGAVYKAKCDTLPCAAKLIHPILFAPPQEVPSQGKEHRLPLQRFEAECRFLSLIKHPNIVQYLGTYHDPETNVPVLLMELMDESLTHFLETPHNAVLFHTQVNILHDTALALAFLHSNRILHRDLSSNNVLIAGSRAKVTDFGMSRFADPSPHITTVTQTPGTPAYMPPEARSKPPICSEKLDCFSFGVLTVQTITRKFPDPADEHKNRELFDSQGEKLQVRVAISEVERRQSHISLFPVAHPLRPIALDCLKDKDVERPTAQQLCERLEELKSTPLYESSIGQIRDRDLLVQSQGETTCEKEKDQQIIQDLRQTNQAIKQEIMLLKLENQKLQTQIDKLLKDKSEKTEQGNQPTMEYQQQPVIQEHRQLNQDGSVSEPADHPQSVIDNDTFRHIQQLHTQLQQLELKLKHHRQIPFKLTWTKTSNHAPSTMKRGSCTVVGNILYTNPYNSRKVYQFECSTLQWMISSYNNYWKNSTLTNINGKLTIVGGIDINFATDKLVTLNGQKWVELYPPMPTARSETTVLSTTTHVVVIGGRKSGAPSELLNITEILNIETKVWSAASPLPYSTTLATITLCKEIIYLMGGATDTEHNYNFILSCQLKDLVEHSVPVKKWSFTTTRCKYNVWHRLPNLPVKHSTCVTVQDCLLAIGGTTVDYNNTKSNIYSYDKERNRWVSYSNMAIRRSACLATVLPGNNLFVVGGVTQNGQETDEAEIATSANI